MILPIELHDELVQAISKETDKYKESLPFVKTASVCYTIVALCKHHECVNDVIRETREFIEVQLGEPHTELLVSFLSELRVGICRIKNITIKSYNSCQQKQSSLADKKHLSYFNW